MISFVADRVRLNGPRIDGSYTLSFEVGEYMYDSIKDIPKLNNAQIYVTVNDHESKTSKSS